MKFTGTIEQLQALVKTLDKQGHWRNEGSFFEFVTDNGEKLNWWHETGIITIIGHPQEVKKFSQELNEVLDKKS